MAENNIVTREDLQNTKNELLTAVDNSIASAVTNAVVQLTVLIKETVQESATATEAKFTAEMDRRFTESKNDMTKRFRRAERKQQTFQKEMENQFHQVRGSLMIGFAEAKTQAEKIAKDHYRELEEKVLAE